MKSNKKGQTVGTLPVTIVSLVVAIIIIVLGLIMVQEIRDVDINFEGSSISNETGGFVNQTGYTLGGVASPGARSFVITEIRNASNSADILVSANYTLSSAGVLTNATKDTFGTVQIDYTFEKGTEAYKTANTSITGLGTFGDFIPLIVLAVAASIIIGLILGGFALSRRNR